MHIAPREAQEFALLREIQRTLRLHAQRHGASFEEYRLRRRVIARMREIVRPRRRRAAR